MYTLNTGSDTFSMLFPITNPGKKSWFFKERKNVNHLNLNLFVNKLITKLLEIS